MLPLKGCVLMACYRRKKRFLRRFFMPKIRWPKIRCLCFWARPIVGMERKTDAGRRAVPVATSDGLLLPVEHLHQGESLGFLHEVWRQNQEHVESTPLSAPCLILAVGEMRPRFHISRTEGCEPESWVWKMSWVVCSRLRNKTLEADETLMYLEYRRGPDGRRRDLMGSRNLFGASKERVWCDRALREFGFLPS